ncbi:GNAT family N-acetyltransferase [Tardiphaga sp. P9-11]|uniref:GNAT family N-acetyltransferase n=1 Tax=Tardiphaga sp. P9-11 TaxID=2024614 RepID=UPI0011F0A3FA|nr:GNAT family N-acetyltransferase [Tardiphaga sp. P9-11]KAA0076998.1 GNAT family N-acetyltransferase [Tardiphaga sp. P9-11]
MNCEVRHSKPSDASDISKVIISALRETNSRDYSPEIIASVEESFAPEKVEALIAKRTVFTAEIEGRIVGTASLDQAVVRTVFVSPDAQGTGVGKLLISSVIEQARQRGIEKLSVPSTVTAERFYERMGFKSVRDEYHGDERTIVMECHLCPMHS